MSSEIVVYGITTSEMEVVRSLAVISTSNKKKFATCSMCQYCDRIPNGNYSIFAQHCIALDVEGHSEDLIKKGLKDRGKIVKYLYMDLDVENGDAIALVYNVMDDPMFSPTCGPLFSNLDAFYASYPETNIDDEFNFKRAMFMAVDHTLDSCSREMILKAVGQMVSIANDLHYIQYIATQAIPLFKMKKKHYLGVLAARLKTNLNSGGGVKGGSYLTKRCELLYDTIICNKSFSSGISKYWPSSTTVEVPSELGIRHANQISETLELEEVQECIVCLRSSSQDEFRELDTLPVLVDKIDDSVKGIIVGVFKRINCRIKSARLMKVVKKDHLNSVITAALVHVVKVVRLVHSKLVTEVVSQIKGFINQLFKKKSKSKKSSSVQKDQSADRDTTNAEADVESIVNALNDLTVDASDDDSDVDDYEDSYSSEEQYADDDENCLKNEALSGLRHSVDEVKHVDTSTSASVGNSRIYEN